MQENRTRYPSYNLLNEQEHWDEHTREIVLKRVGPFKDHKFLDEHEAKLILAIARHIVYEDRKEILAYVVHHLDSTLASPIGEDQRKVGIPPKKELIRQGLKFIDKLANKEFHAPFLDIEVDEQLSLLESLDKGKATQISGWPDNKQKALFNKLATEISSAYYSHPIVWSEIGYGGPAYPRGYVRVEKSLTDPWEAKRDANE